MPLVDSLLGAIIRLDGNALVMHVGEKPYVVTGSASLDPFRGPLSWGQVELATKRLTLEAVAGMMRQLLPPDEQQALSDFGAIEHQLAPNPKVPGRFTVIAARGGDDIWLEIRYHRTAEPRAAAAPAGPPVEVAPPAPPEPAPPLPYEPPPLVAEAPAEEPLPAEPAPVELAVGAAADEGADRLTLPDEGEVIAPVAIEPVAEEVTIEPVLEEAAVEPAVEEVAIVPPVEEAIIQPAVEEVTVEPAAEEAVGLEPVWVESEIRAPMLGVEPAVEAVSAAPVVEEVAIAPPVEEATIQPAVEDVTVEPVAEPAVEELTVEPAAEAVALESVVEEAVTMEPVWIEPEAVAVPAVETVAVPLMQAVPTEPEPAPPAIAEEFRPAPLPPAAVQVTVSPAHVELRGTPLGRLLRLAADRGASALYIVAQSQPAIRVDGEIAVLESEGVLTAIDVAAMLKQPSPEEGRETPQLAVEAEWIADVPGVGRVRCLSFRDHRGPGGIFRMLPARALSVEQLGLSPVIQALVAESEGLVLVAGPRASGKRTLISAFVDLVNRTRADYVITLESQVLFVHGSRRSFVSQRELGGTGQDLAAAARAALRENPDVLVIEDLRSPELISVALEAAELGLLVFAALPASGAQAAIERLIDQFAPERRAQVQTIPAGALRGVVAQVLVRKIGGGRLAAREVLVNTRAVAALIAEGRTAEIPPAIEGGRRLGMVPLNDALIDAVRSGAVHPAEAYRRTYDHDGVLEGLRREGLDTSFVERLT